MVSRYDHISPEAGRQLWREAWQSSEQGQAGPNAALRWREVRLIGGLVLPVWDIVSRALSKQPRVAERRLQVVRILLTGQTHPPSGCLWCSGCSCML